MLNRRTFFISMAGLALVVGAFLVFGDRPFQEKKGPHDELSERGPHGGRLLRDGDLSLEITIFEEGVPPELHIYAYDDGKPVMPSAVQLSVVLARLGGKQDRVSFSPEGDYLKSGQTVEEPHSFDVTVDAIHDKKKSRWSYAAYEGRTTIEGEAAQAAGLRTEPAGPARIQELKTLTGRIVLKENKTAVVKARFAGIVRDVRRVVGETVKPDDVLALVESNDSLQLYSVKAPIGGVVVSRETNIGDVAADKPLFVIADTSEVWAEFHVFPRDLGRIKDGQRVRVANLGGLTGNTVLTTLLPTADLTSQTVVARASLENPDGRWRPGMAVRGDVIVSERDVPLAVKLSGLQRFRDFSVVFAKVGDIYEVRMLELGVKDGTWAEVRDGLDPGEVYVAENSFLVKADIEKSGASHDH
jgi:cobalt-zinc-cadmium efflux system membrane fusion protein